MSSFSDHAEKNLLDHLLGTSSYTSPSVYLSLHTEDPGESSYKGEVSAGNYSRQGALTFNNASGSGSGPSTATNANKIQFAEAASDWGTVSHFALYDSGSTGSGNMLAHGALNTSKSVTSGDQVEIAAGSLEIDLD